MQKENHLYQVDDMLLGDNRAQSVDFFVANERILERSEIRTEELTKRGIDLNRLSYRKVVL